MTSPNNGARLRAGLAAVAAATALLATAWGAAPADAAPAPHSGADASGDLYWSNTTASGNSMIGRARLDGTDVNQNFIAVPDGPSGVSALAVNARYIYWTDETAGTIGRARLDGTQVNQQFITGAAFPQTGLAIDSRYIYWVNNTAGTIGRARLDGTEVNQQFITVPDADILLGVAVDPGPHD